MDLTKSDLGSARNAHMQQPDDVARLAKGAGISVSGKMIGRGLNFLGQTILARLLGAEVFGLYSIGWTFLRMITIIGPAGLDAGIIRFGAKYWRDDHNNFRRVFFFSTAVALVSGLVIGVGLYLTSPFLTLFFRKPGLEYVLRGFAFAIPFITTLRVVASATTVSQRLKFATYAEEISQPAFEIVIFLVLFYLAGWKLVGAVLAGVISFVLALALAVFYMFQLFPRLLVQSNEKIPSQPAVPFQLDLLRFSIPTAFAALFGSFISWADRLLVGYFRSEAETGIYTTISLLSIVFIIILSGIKNIYSPMIADLVHKGEMPRVEEIYRISTKWGLYISIPIFLVILFAAPQILTFFFGGEYAAGALALVLLAVSQVINIGTGPLDTLLVMTGRQKKWLYLSGAMLGLNILVNIILIPRYGLLGAAIGTAATVSGISIIGLIMVRCDLKVWPYDRRFSKIALAAAVTVGALVGISYIHIPTPFLRLLVVGFITCLVFIAVIILQGLDAEDKELIVLLRRKLQALLKSLKVP